MCNICKRVLARQFLRLAGRPVDNKALEKVFPSTGKYCANVKRGLGFLRITPTHTNRINTISDLYANKLLT